MSVHVHKSWHFIALSDSLIQKLKIFSVHCTLLFKILIPFDSNYILRLLRCFVFHFIFVNVYTGHNGAITSMIVPQQSQYLLTGSEDTSVILWDMKTLYLKLRIR